MQVRLLAQFPTSDQSIKDSSRFFFGNADAKVIYSSGKTIYNPYLVDLSMKGFVLPPNNRHDAILTAPKHNNYDKLDVGLQTRALAKTARDSGWLPEPGEVAKLIEYRSKSWQENKGFTSQAPSVEESENNRKDQSMRDELIESCQVTKVDLSDLSIVEMEPPTYAISQIVPNGVVTLLAGHGGSGKTIASLTLVAHVSCGQSWSGLDCATGKAVFVSLEDNGQLCKYRLKKIAKQYGLSFADIERNCVILDASDSVGSLSTEDRHTGKWVESPLWNAIKDACHGARLVIIDNASDAYSGNEIVRREVRTFLRMLGKLAKQEQCGLVLLAHVDKEAVKTGSKGQGYSGSTAWHNSVRSALELKACDNGAGLHHNKSNFGPKMATPIQMTFEGGVLVPAAERRTPDMSRSNGEMVFSLMQKVFGTGNTYIPGGRTGTYSFFNTLKHHGLPEGVTTQAVYQGLDYLIHEKRVRIEAFKKDSKDRIRAVFVSTRPDVQGEFSPVASDRQ